MEEITGTSSRTTPPADAMVPDRSPHAPEPGAEIPSHYRWCFGCGVDHPTGLHMRITAGVGLDVFGVFVVGEHHQGAPGLAHGGLLTLAVDEILGSLNWLLATPAVTGRIECDFRRPVPIGSQLHVSAQIIGQKGRRVYMKATGRLGDDEGAVALTAAAIFVQVPIDHFISNGQQEFVKQAMDDRRQGAPAWRPGSSTQTLDVNP